MKHDQHDKPAALCDEIIAAVLDAGDAAAAVGRAWPDDLGDPTLVRIVAMGKASMEMARAAVDRLGADERHGVVAAVPERIAGTDLPTSIKVFPADHPLPTARNLEAADAIERFIRLLDPSRTLLVLISGGGSAHLCAPWEGLTLDDLAEVTEQLLRAGATIDQLNAVRKHCERLKGGRLAAITAASGVRVCALVLSDVLGDPLDTIASGPLVPDPTTFADALDALNSMGLVQQCSAIAAHLERGVAGQIPETPKPGSPVFDRVRHTIIANNDSAVDSAASVCEDHGLRIIDRRTGVRGEASTIGRELARALIGASKTKRTPIAIIWGGETTVRVGSATGSGGRNQELALACAIELAGHQGVAAMTLATDGIDGPTDAAGALVTGQTMDHAASLGIDLPNALACHDSHTVLSKLKALIRTGPTGTNINDVAVAWTANPHE